MEKKSREWKLSRKKVKPVKLTPEQIEKFIKKK